MRNKKECKNNQRYVLIILTLLTTRVMLNVAQNTPILNPVVAQVLEKDSILLDKTFNEAIYQAGTTATLAANGKYTAYPSNLPQTESMALALQAKSDVVVMGGFLLIDLLVQTAPTATTTKFAFIDASISGFTNVVSAIFREDQAGYLAGVVAGTVSTSKKVGCVGGIPIPPVLGFCNGF